MTFALGWEGYLGAKEALITIDKVRNERNKKQLSLFKVSKISYNS